MAEYLSTPVGRNHRTGGDWTRSNLNQTRHALTRALRGHQTRLALEVDRILADTMRAQASRRTVRENTSKLRGLLRWGATVGYFTPAQAEMIPDRCSSIAPSLKGTAAPKRRRKARAVGQADEFICDEDAPDGQQIAAVGTELERFFPLWAGWRRILRLTAGCAGASCSRCLPRTWNGAGTSRGCCPSVTSRVPSMRPEPRARSVPRVRIPPPSDQRAGATSGGRGRAWVS